MKIHIDRLRDGRVEKIEETLSPEFLEVSEEELAFKETITVKGEAYLAEDHLFITLNGETTLQMPCQICNRTTKLPLIIEKFTHAEELTDIKSAIYDAAPLLREAILLQIPPFAECAGNSCPERGSLNKYLKDRENPIHFPFAGLE
ncbi:MAG: hypothetical protein HYX48_01470 [Chlamydiales bacterium]|nr:hypothetical protein [Chlamydiales bacterium]